MARLTWTGWAGIVGPALLVTLAAMPSTRWVCRRHTDMALGRLATPAFWPFEAAQTENRAFSPHALIAQAAPAQPKNAREGLLAALAISDYDARRTALSALSDRYPADPFVQAVLGRYAAKMGISSQKPPERPTGQRLEVVHMLLKAGARGERSDPDNAYFAMITAAGEYAMQQPAKARAAMLRAGDKTEYREYAWDEVNLQASTLQGSHFAGNYATMMVCASLIFPYYAHQKALTRQFVAGGTPADRMRARLASLRFADTLSRHSDTVIAMLVAAACAKLAVKPDDRPDPVDYRTKPKVADRDILEWTRSLQQRAIAMGLAVPGFDPVASMRMHLIVGKAATQWGNERRPDEFTAPTAGILFSVRVLLTTLGIVVTTLLFGLGGRLRENSGASLALPMLPTLVIDGAALSLPDPWARLQAACLMAGFIMAWLPSVRKGAWWCAGAACAMGVLGGLLGADYAGTLLKTPAQLGALALVASLAVSQAPMPRWLAWCLAVLEVVALSCALAVVYSHAALNGTLGWATLGVTAAIASAALCVGVSHRIPLHRIVGPCVLLGALAYGFGIRHEIKQDQGYRVMLDEFRTEVKTVRGIAAQVKLDE